jgi:hypothetical protein
MRLDSIDPITVLGGEYEMPVQESDEWIKELPSGKKVRHTYQLLTTGFSASAEILEPVDATMVYTHTHTDLPPPADREQIEEEFADDLARVETHRGRSRLLHHANWI